MFKHLFKLIWNKKKQNFLLMSEMLVSFLVIFAVFTLMVYYYSNYKKPIGLEYENLWLVSYNNSNLTQNTDSLNLYYETLRQEMKALPQVKNVSFCSNNVPFSQNQWTGDIHYKNATYNTDFFIADDHYKDALSLSITAGRWFGKNDAVSKNRPVIINEALKQELFGNEDPIGKLIGQDAKKPDMKVVGVIQSIKAGGDYAVARGGLYQRADTGSFHGFGRIMVQVTPGADAAFEGRLYKMLANYMKNSNVEIEHMLDKKKSSNLFSLVPMIVTLVVASFLVINVALGLFGVMWYNISKRRGEIGLRRAIGATGRSVSAQLVTESVILATLSLIVGGFFAVQFPLLSVFNLQASVYIIAMVLAIVFIYLLVLACSLYPGKQAAAIDPAVALHEE